MILKSITFSDASTTDNDVLESVQVRMSGSEYLFITDLVARDDWDEVVLQRHVARPKVKGAEIRAQIQVAIDDRQFGLISLTAEQALFLATVTSGQSQRSIEAIWPGRHVDNDSVCDCLAFGVFNRIWGSTDGARAEVFG